MKKNPLLFSLLGVSLLMAGTRGEAGDPGYKAVLIDEGLSGAAFVVEANVRSDSMPELIAVVFQGDGQSLKPVGPPVIQVSLEADFVALMLVMFLVECLSVTHHAPRVFPFVVCLPKGYCSMW